MKWFGSSEKNESDDYEKKYLARYKKQQKPKQKKNMSKNKKDVEIESDEKNQVKVKIQKKEPDSLSTKFESVKQEYNVTIKNLMDAKKVLNGIKEDIQKSNSEYADIISKTKLSRVELLKTNNELQKKTEVNAKKIRECLEKAPGCKVVDETKDGGYITPVESSGDFVTYISRIREDKTQKNSINMWVVSDNLLKGAALNAVQIANVLIKKYIN